MNSETQALETEYETKSLIDLLVSTPPGGVYLVPDLGYHNHHGRLDLSVPSIQLHCQHESCSGVRFFDGSATTTALSGMQNIFMTYRCRNCNEVTKTFALKAFTEAMSDGSHKTIAMKMGEAPPYGPPTPGRVISLIGPDRELFLKGRRAEIQGLGIGAFAYYRRVVENQKGRLIDEIRKVAEHLGADRNMLATFDRARNETQFQRAIELTKPAIPQALLIQAQNPLSLLHNALSEGLHERSDAQCLELATSIRVVLTELAEKISQVLKDEREIREAVSRLLNRPASE